MKTKTYFADSAGNSLTEHLGGLDDYAMAVAAYWAAIQTAILLPPPTFSERRHRCLEAAERP